MARWLRDRRASRFYELKREEQRLEITLQELETDRRLPADAKAPLYAHAAERLLEVRDELNQLRRKLRTGS